MERFIIYGAGERGRWCLDFLEWRRMNDRVLAFCDQKYEEFLFVNDKEVLPYEEAKKKGVPFLVSCKNDATVNEILSLIRNDGGKGYPFEKFYEILDEEQTDFLRERCAYHHARHNDKWFEDAEKEEAVAVFWESHSLFYQDFQKLDLKNVIELACGRGRHVSHYLKLAGRITLVDILEENMHFCEERFKDMDKISFYQNNGYNLAELASDSYSALFSYDSMVHFEMLDVYEYLKDIYRVLMEGGRALLHHSNYSADYKTDFSKTPHARCFMSKDIFAYLANRVGFKRLEQRTIDWYGAKDLDCITLLEK